MDKRTPSTLIKDRVYREDMTWEEERDFVKHMFGRYEKSGFFTTYSPVRTLPEDKQIYKGKPYKIIKRMEVPNTQEEEKRGMLVMDLPAWLIEFEDGNRMVAYPEDISKLDVTGMAACWKEKNKMAKVKKSIKVKDVITSILRAKKYTRDSDELLYYHVCSYFNPAIKTINT